MIQPSFKPPAMKKTILLITVILLYFGVSSQPIRLFLGVNGGFGDMLTQNQFSNFQSTGNTSNNGWSSHAKAQALLGIGRLRVGYQFLYNFSSPSIDGQPVTPVNSDQNTTYFNASQVHFFGQYLLVELAVINTKHFALAPGIAVGSFTGYKIDNTTHDEVTLSQTTHHRFSIGADLNLEFKFAKRWTFLVSPNYYLFSLQDNANSDWHEYLHFMGIDAGIRLNLLKIKDK
jgi:hypothetical protein